MSNSTIVVREPLTKLRGHTGSVNCVAISPEGFRAASGGEDGTVRLWQIYDMEEVSVAHLGSPVKCVCYGDDDTTVVAGCKNGKISYWAGLDAGLREGTIDGAGDQDSGWIKSLAYIPQAARIIFSAYPTSYGALRMYYLGAREWSSHFSEEPAGADCIAVEPEGKWFAVADGYEIRVYNVPEADTPPEEDPDLLCVIPYDGEAISALAIGENENIVIGDGDGVISVWDLASRSRTLHFKAHEYRGLGVDVTGLEIKGRRLLSTGDSTVRLWKVNSGECIAVFHHGADQVVLGASMRHSGSRAVSAGSDGLFVWDVSALGITSAT